MDNSKQLLHNIQNYNSNPLHLKNTEWSNSASLWDSAGTYPNCLIFTNALIKNVCTLAKKSFPPIVFCLSSMYFWDENHLNLRNFKIYSIFQRKS